jgi:S1-C subfamily serine protease
MDGSKESSRRFFISSNGKTSGPFTSEQLRNLVQSRRLSPEDQVRKESGDKWYSASEVQGLFDPEFLGSRQSALIPESTRTARRPRAPQANVAAPQKSSHSLGIASLCVGVLAVCMCWIPFLGFALAGTGLALGLVGLLISLARKGAGIGFPIAGSTLSVVAFVPSVLFFIFVARLADAARVANEKATHDEVKPKPAAVETKETNTVVAAKPVAGQVQPVVAVAKTPLEALVENSINSVALIQGKSSQGTGFVIEPHVVATNRHVIAGEPIDALSVHFPKEPTPFKAKLLYEDDLQDLAFLRVETSAKPLLLCPACTCRPGQDIVAIGNPGLGGLVLQNTISKGLMSSDITIEGHPFYQLSISINPGNSGGPVLDNAGQVVGVTTLKATKNEGVAFCIPASQVRAAYGRAQTLSPQDIALVEYKHRASLTQEEHSSTRESVASLKDKLVERFDLDPVLRGNWRLYATSKNRGETVDQSAGGVLFAQASAIFVRLFGGGKRMQINTVYVNHDDNGDPGNLVLFSTGVLWTVTKKPNQEYVVVQVGHVEDSQIVETFRFLVTVEGGPTPSEPKALSPEQQKEQDRLAREKEEQQLERNRKNDEAEAKFASVLALAKESIRKKRYAGARASLLRIIKEAPGTDIADKAQSLLDSIASSPKTRRRSSVN